MLNIFAYTNIFGLVTIYIHATLTFKKKMSFSEAKPLSLTLYKKQFKMDQISKYKASNFETTREKPREDP
jgi:hypothetical protein